MAYTAVPTVVTGQMWTASDHNTYIRDNFAAGVPAIFSAKGDLAVASALNVAARLPVGADGLALLADSSQALGVKWGVAAVPLKATILRKSASQAISNGNGAILTWDTEDLDDLGAHDLVTNNSRITIQEDGLYVFFNQVLGSSSGTTGDWSLRYYKNGAQTASIGYATWPYAQVAGFVVSIPTLLVAGDYVEIYLYNGQGSTWTVTTNSRFAAVKLK